MADPREALVARERVEYGESWDVLVPEVGWTLGRIIESVIEDVRAALDVPPRGELPSPTSPHAQTHMDNLDMSLVEQIAREHARTDMLGNCLCGATGIGFVVSYAEHIATATEQAVRERVAADLKAASAEDTGWPVDPEQIALTYRRAARTARGEGA